MTTAAPDIAAVWARIETHQGAAFTTIRGETFTYVVVHGHVVLDQTHHRISKSDFEKAISAVPFRSTGPLQGLRGGSFIYAILMDPRIRQMDW